MLLRSYVVGKFTKQLFAVTLLITLLMALAQLMQTAHLILGLSFRLSASYLLLLLAYAFVVAVGFAVFPAAAGFLTTLKEERFFHTLYTFGVPARRVLFYLLGALFLITLTGVAVSFFVNYQKIAYFTKYLKFKFGEEILLTAPPKSFSTFETFSVYFEERRGREFKNFLIKLPSATATSRTALLSPDGLLHLRDATLFTEMSGKKALIKSRTYTFNVVSPYTYRGSKKKERAEFAFNAAVFIFALIAFPLFFALLLAKVQTRLGAYLLAFGFLIVQFAVALAVKGALK